MKILLSIYVILAFLLLPLMAEGQRVLYLEQMTEVKAMKFYEGQQVQVKLKDDPGEWYTITLESLMEEEKVIVYQNGMLNLDNISHLRIQRDWVVGISIALKTFAGASLVYGTLSLASSNPPTIIGIIGVSGTSYLLGWLIKKAWQYKVYKIGKKNRLKIIDLSLPVQERVIRP